MPSMFTVGRRLQAPADRVWDLLTDTRTWPAWGPSVRRVHCPERFIRAGSTGRVQTVVGVWLPFVIQRFEDGCFWDWRVGGVPATGHRVVAEGLYACRLTFTVPFWALGYLPVCRQALQRIQRLLAEDPAEMGS